MFGHDHEGEQIAERIDHLMAAVFVADEDERMEALTRHVAPDLVYVSPEAVFEGPQGLSDAFSRYRSEAWWQTGLRRTSPIDLHHGYFRFTWERVERGATVMEGWSFGSPGRGRRHLPGRHVRGIGARADRRPIMNVRQMGRER